ncbi:MAG: AEC family transporter [Clostridia bacterium]|nr:AEC family transporter [Clostridia bacterium]
MQLFLTSLSKVSTQVAILFIMMLVGFVFGKLGKITDVGIKQMTTVLLWLVTPCVIIYSFCSMQFTSDRLYDMLWVSLCAVITHFVGFLFGLPLFKGQPDATKRVLRFGTVFSNCGFMSIPLVSAIFGEDGVFYCSVFVVVFNILSWTLGVFIYGQKLNLKKAVFNPGVIGFVIAFVLFLFSVKLPLLISEPIYYFSQLNSPLAMLVTGAILSGVALRFTKSDLNILFVCFLRLIAVPAVTVALLTLFDMPNALLLICMIPASAPTASNTSLFAVLFGSDTKTASRLVAVSTALSIITMPVIYALVSVMFS